MMRNSTLTKYDFNYNHTFTVAHDYDLWVRMFDHCSFANLPDPLLKYRMHNNQNSKKSEEQNDAETSRVLTNLLEKMGFQLNDSELVIHNKIFNGIGIDSVTIVKAFRYLIRLRSSNLREKIFEPIAFNEFLKLNWRRIMFKHNHKFMYWISVLLFLRPVNFNKVIYSRFSLLLIMINNK